MSNIFWIITQVLLKELITLLISTAIFIVVALVFYGISLKKLWQQERLRTVLALMAIAALSLGIFLLLISPSLESPFSVRWPNRTIPMLGPTPTRYGLEKPMIGTVTWTPSPTHTPTSTYTPTPVHGFPSPTHTPTPTYNTPTPVHGFPSPTHTPTPTYNTPTPTHTPTPPCFGEDGLFYFEQPTVNSEFVFGTQIPIVIRFNPQLRAKMGYTYYSIHFSSENPRDLNPENMNTIKPKTSLKENVKDNVIYHTWNPLFFETFWISALFYDERGQYSTEPMRRCAVKIEVK